MHRAEHWMVVQGTTIVSIGEPEKLITENECIHIPWRTNLRLENLGKVPVILIEVETGIYLEEGSIICHDGVLLFLEGLMLSLNVLKKNEEKSPYEQKR